MCVIASCSAPVAPASATPPQTGGCLKTLKKVAIVAAVMIALAAVVTLATYSWPAAVAVVGIVGIVALITYIYRKCHGTSKISPQIVSPSRVLGSIDSHWIGVRKPETREHSFERGCVGQVSAVPSSNPFTRTSAVPRVPISLGSTNPAAVPVESASTIDRVRSWHKDQIGVRQPWIGVRQPWNTGNTYSGHIKDLNQAEAKQDLARCIGMDDLVTTTISYADVPISFSEEIIGLIINEITNVSEGTIERLFQDVKVKVTAHLPTEFEDLAEEMVLVASRLGAVSDALAAESLRLDAYKEDKPDLEVLCLSPPEAAAGNKQILFSQSGNTVTITVKSKTTLTASVNRGGPERVGDVYLVSEFTYKKVKSWNPFASPFIKSYQYRTEYA